MRRLISTSVGSIAFCLVASAVAHIDLDYPPSRSGNAQGNQQKTGPCEGLPRSSTPEVLQGGQELTVEWRETVNHSSHYRIALLLDGQNFPNPTGQNDYCDPEVDSWCIADNLPDGNGGSHTYTFTLPNVDCDNCTLQLIQYMYEPGPPLYFRCADIVIVASEGGDGDGDGDISTGGSDGADTGGSSGVGGNAQGVGGTSGVGGNAQGVGGTSGGGLPTPTGGTSSTGEEHEDDPQPDSATSSDSGGCSIAHPATSLHGLTLLAAAGALLRRRRR